MSVFKDVIDQVVEVVEEVKAEIGSEFSEDTELQKMLKQAYDELELKYPDIGTIYHHHHVCPCCIDSSDDEFESKLRIEK